MSPLLRGCAGWLAAITSIVLMTMLSTPTAIHGPKVWLPTTPAEHQAAAMKAQRYHVQPVPWWRLW
jgi:hypothetical protein